MVGHLLEYHPAVARLKQLIDEDELGSLFYVYGNRLNLGKLRADENALWSLGAHDVSVALHLIGEEPAECLAHGASYVREGVEDVVFCYLRFPSGIVAHLHLSWLDPHKERRLTVVGSRRMATFDDMLVEGKLAVYDKGFDEDARSWGEYITRSGDIFSPRIANAEPLRLECEHFVQCVRTGQTPRSDGAERPARGARARAPAALARRLSRRARLLSASPRSAVPPPSAKSPTGAPAKPAAAQIQLALPRRRSTPAVRRSARMRRSTRSTGPIRWPTPRSR